MKQTLYLQDVLSQPAALQRAVKEFDARSLRLLAQKFRQRAFQRMVITGMGASYYAAYPAWLQLTSADTPALWVDAAELLHYGLGVLQPGTLLWVLSQSGRSVEIVELLERLEGRSGVVVLATTNDLQSPLAQQADFVVPINAQVEKTVSTRTMMNTLGLSLLLARLLLDRDLAPVKTDLLYTSQQMALYLNDWEKHLQFLERNLGLPDKFVLLGRGASVCSAYYGALILGEAAKYPAIAMQTAMFRHGPIEMTHPDLHVCLFAGEKTTLRQNLAMLEDVITYGGRAYWLSTFPYASISEEMLTKGAVELPAPGALGSAFPLAEIAALQLLSVHFAQTQGFVPGEFRYIGKVTLKE